MLASAILLVFVVRAISDNIIIKKFEQCDQWASENECSANPSFMWTSCHHSCFKGPTRARDVEHECLRWAEEGECTANPGFVQIHCPVSCAMALGWSPWARRSAGVQEMLTVEEDTIFTIENDALIPRDTIAAANLIRDRLHMYFDGGAVLSTGLSSSAPTEYLGMMGLAEAFLYTLRLYGLALKAPNALINDEYKNDILRTVSAGYDSDRLMRNLPTWIRFLDDIAQKATDSSTTELVSFERITSISPGVSIPQIDLHIDKDEPFAKLRNGTIMMPLIGLGTWQLNGDECEATVREAILMGYRHIDSAQAYGNEVQVGWAVRNLIAEGKVERKDLFLATKISNEEDAGYEGVKRLVNQQLKNLQTTYIDLYMLHSPLPDDAMQAETWRALEDMHEQGIIRAIGVSNFDGRELRKLIKTATRIKPMVVQNKLDIYHIGKQLDDRGDDIVQYARDQGILLVGYSTLSAYPFSMVPAQDPIVKYVANEVSNRTGTLVTPAQVILRWALQNGFAVIPRSTNKQRLSENLAAASIPQLLENELNIIKSIQYLVTSSVAKAVSI